MRRRIRRDEGFSMLELMVVVAILGILVMIAVASYRMSTSTARRVTCKENQRNLTTSVSLYEQDHDGARPAVLVDLTPYVTNYASASKCPNGDGTLLVYDPVGNRVTCPNHP
ncbi:MAG: prepilin-type N-terminal cleavage/methylation domain-containing protein [Actinomycetota bacterium]|nr:prepilin-type N-terminal cleavage/methylation domain-containing protein [Actinomycetota bacterium]